MNQLIYMQIEAAPTMIGVSIVMIVVALLLRGGYILLMRLLKKWGM
jgi:hypothetical protein